MTSGAVGPRATFTASQLIAAFHTSFKTFPALRFPVWELTHSDLPRRETQQLEQGPKSLLRIVHVALARLENTDQSVKTPHQTLLRLRSQILSTRLLLSTPDPDARARGLAAGNAMSTSEGKREASVDVVAPLPATIPRAPFCVRRSSVGYTKDEKKWLERRALGGPGTYLATADWYPRCPSRTAVPMMRPKKRAKRAMIRPLL